APPDSLRVLPGPTCLVPASPRLAPKRRARTWGTFASLTDSRLRRPAPAVRRAHRNRRTVLRFSRGPAGRRRRFPAEPADRATAVWLRWFQSEKCMACRQPAVRRQKLRQRATWPTPDAAANGILAPPGAPFLRGGAPGGGYRNTATARGLAIHRARPWSSASRRDGRRRRHRMRCVL